ncbi:helix-hairpin-helix domain-containing protein [bacterium]|nr:helix-hairpin-helix domain-containing protein [bacterium]
MKQLFRSALEWIEISKFERRAVIALLFFVAGIAIYRVYYWNVLYFDAPAIDYVAKYNQIKADKEEPRVLKLHSFNPNEVAIEELMSMGLEKSLAFNIVNFREKVHPFYSVEDVRKLYLMDSAIFLQLSPYIILPERENKWSKTYGSSNKERSKTKKKFNPDSKHKEEIYIVDLNLCEEDDLKQLPGIGPVYAKRILGFRKLLGGYVQLNQLKEVYGIEDSLYSSLLPFLKLSKDSLVQIQINSIDIKTLSKHPYIDYKNAKLLVRYRESHGAFKSLDFDQIHGLDQRMISRLLPYLTLD